MNSFIENEFETLKILTETRPEFTLDRIFELEIERKASQSSEELRLCRKDFQKSLELNDVNRTLFLYEIVYETRSTLKFLFLILDNVGISLLNEKNFTSKLSSLFSVECSLQNKVFDGFFVFRNVSEDDRSVIVQCNVNRLDKTQDQTVEIRFLNQQTKMRYDLKIDLCPVNFPHGYIGLCLPPLTKALPAFFLQQWLDFHLLIGVEQILIYDENRFYERFFQNYVERKQIIYYSFPLPQLIIFQQKPDVTQQLIAQTHCMMSLQPTFEWIGTWNFDQYLHFFSKTTKTFYSNNGRSMFKEFLSEHFPNVDSIRFNSMNYLSMVKKSIETNFLVEKFIFRRSNSTLSENFLIRTDSKDFLVDLTTKFNETTSMHLNFYPIKNSPIRLNRKTSDSILDESLWKIFKVLIEIHRQTSSKTVRESSKSNSLETDSLIEQISNVEEENV